MEGNELRQWRDGQGLTQLQLAEALSVATNTVARWERDERAIPPFLPLALETVERKIKAEKKKK